MCRLIFQTRLTEKIGLYTEENQVKDIQLDRITSHARVGSIYLGKVRNIDRSIEAAFIEIDKNVVGFLSKKEYPFNSELGSKLTEGSSIIVQVIKEAYQDKGPRLTANITYAGASMVYLPYSGYLAFSKKLTEDDRIKMESLLKHRLTVQEGLIIRTKSVDMAEDELLEQLEQLRKTHVNLLEFSKNKKAPCRLQTVNQVPDQMLNQYQSLPLTEIIFDQKQIMKQMQQKFPDLADKMLYKQSVSLPGDKSIDQILEEAVQPTVRTKDGIVLTIEQTEGLTVIDIDSSQYQSRQNRRSTLYHINQKSIRPIATEIRKRNISGIILIDFLKMKNREEQQHILQLLRKELACDPIRTEVYGFTKLGLAEMTRKREHVGILQLLTDKSSTIGYKKTIESFAYQFERELLAWNGTKTEAVIVACSPEFHHFIQQYILRNIADLVTIDVYQFIDSNTSNYHIVRSGSGELVQEYIDQKKEWNIDKVL
ncbi:ribonuclease E/G [Gracilibacillus xinjiangensis]|uniref:Ribonuclease E/G n=1 Tax=Gracilibacillus xinjiangensis TaxID=1193282 RepID=A0ABV8WVS7_9BACI